jgi:hypothetical protein
LFNVVVNGYLVIISIHYCWGFKQHFKIYHGPTKVCTSATNLFWLHDFFLRGHFAFIPTDIANILLYLYISMWMVYFKEIKINKMLIAISKKTCYLQLIVTLCFTKWMSRHFLTYKRGTNMLQKVRYWNNSRL